MVIRSIIDTAIKNNFNTFDTLFCIVTLGVISYKLFKHLNKISFYLCLIITINSTYCYKFNCIALFFDFLPLLQFLPLFFAGIIFYKIHTNKDRLILNYILIIFYLYCQIILFNHPGRPRAFINWKEYSIMLFIYFGLFTLLVNNCLKFIVNKSTLFLGKISYALYLVHQYISIKFIIPLFYDKLGMNFWVVICLIDTPIMIIIVTFITYKC